MRNLFFVSLILLSSVASAQLLIPVFEEPVLITPLSSDAQESMPVPFNNATEMFLYRTYERITEKKAEVTAQDVWYAKKGKNNWGLPYREFRDINDQELNHLIGTSKDGQRIYLINRIFVGDSIVSRVCFRERKGKNSWGDFQLMDVPGVDVVEPSTTLFMHPDEDVLLVSMYAMNGSKNLDIYLSEKDANGKWSPLIDLGRNINSSGFEYAPFLSPDKKALFFSSNGHKGMGEADVFIAYRESEGWKRWSRPLNIGAPINSAGPDSYFIISDSSNIFFTSDRGTGNSDIYSTKTTGQYRIASPEVVNGQFVFKGLPPDEFKIAMYDLDGNFIEFISIDETGKFSFEKITADGNFVLKMEEGLDDSFDGSKIYFIDSTGAFIKRVVLAENGQFLDYDNIQERDTITGYYLINNAAIAYEEIVIFDENAYPIDTVYTDGLGQFSYAKLKADKKFDVKPMKKPDGLTDLYLVDESGEKTRGFLGGNETGYGVFLHKGMPVADAIIKILDKNGNILEVIVLNENGEFSYRKLLLEGEFSLMLDQDDANDFVDGIVYFSDAQGKNHKRFVLLSDKKFISVNSEGETKVFGMYKFNKLPMSNTAILLLDENGITIDTLFTDENGMFVYSKMKLDKNVSIRPLEMSGDNSELIELYLTDESGQIAEKLIYNGKTGFMVEKVQIATKEPVKEKPKKEVPASSPKPKHENILFFDFASTDLNAAAKEKLKAYVSTLSNITESKIELTGHTDNIGSEEANLTLGLERANAVKAALIEAGMKESQILVSSKGELQAIGDNNTANGRNLNRRVELKKSN